MTRVLFVCSRNQWRSPTGEAVFNGLPGDRLVARSAGTSPRARHSVSAKDLEWADLVLVMEPKHKQRLRAGFPRLTAYLPITVLDIPDDYRFMDPELVTIFEAEAAELLAESGPDRTHPARG